jgi:hypothetical protein
MLTALEALARLKRYSLETGVVTFFDAIEGD